MRIANLRLGMKTALKALKICVVSWLALAVTASGVSGMVLCTGDDGHFSFEAARDGRCLSSVEHDEHDEHEQHEHADADVDILVSAESDCCDDCVDLSVPSDNLARVSTQLTRTLADAGTLSSMLTSAFWDLGMDTGLSLSAPRVHRPPPLFIFPSLLAQRTVILRV